MKLWHIDGVLQSSDWDSSVEEIVDGKGKSEQHEKEITHAKGETEGQMNAIRDGFVSRVFVSVWHLRHDINRYLKECPRAALKDWGDDIDGWDDECPSKRVYWQLCMLCQRYSPHNQIEM